MSDLNNRFELLSVAYRSRLVCRSEADYCKALKVSGFDAVRGRRESAHDMEVYYLALERLAAQASDKDLSEVIGDYLRASEFYLAADWGERSQLASRKKFCRRLFQLWVGGGRSLGVDRAKRFGQRATDERLQELVFPQGVQAGPAVNIEFLLLLAFEVVRPWNAAKSRGKDLDDRATLRALGRLRELVGTLRADTPRLGSLDKPRVFDDWLNAIDRSLESGEDLNEFTPLRMAAVLMDIGRACRSLADMEQLRRENEHFEGLRMNGIWVDDADQGQTRFWIFPDNRLAAFCFMRNGVGWSMSGYDFRVRDAFNDAYMSSFVMLSPQGNLRYTLWPDRPLDGEQLAAGSYRVGSDPESGEIVEVELFDEPGHFPPWLSWRKWLRLDSASPLYARLRAVVADVFDPRSPQSMIFSNESAELTNVVNNLIGRDNKYLYVYDWRPPRFAMAEADGEVFTYEGVGPNPTTLKGLLELNISPANPLYAIPLQGYRSDYGNAELNRLAAVMADGANIAEVCIIHSERTELPRLIFPMYGVGIEIDAERLAVAGVKCLTSRPN